MAGEISTSSTLNLSKNYVYDTDGDVNYTNGIVIDKSITINGNGYSIDGKNAARIFNITANQVILNNITFINAFTSNSGGAIYNIGNNLTVSNSIFTNNAASVWGGAVYSDASNTTLINNTFNNNKVTASSSSGGAVFLNTNSINSLVNNSVFNSNSAVYSGGGLVVYAKSIIANSVFRNNTVSASLCFGAGLAFRYANGIKVSRCEFISNNAGSTSFGGGIDAESNGEIDSCNFTSNYALRGGGIRIYASALNITNSNFISNTGTHGGAIHFNASSGNYLKNNYFYKNKLSLTSGYGGAINFASSSLNNIIDACVFESNQAYCSGAIHINANSNYILIQNSIFKENSVNSNGGSIEIVGRYAKLINNSFIKNVANKNSGYAGSIYLVEGASNTLINGCSFESNQAYVAGALFIQPNVNYVEIYNSYFRENYVSNWAGAIAWQGKNGKIINCTFFKNTANKDNAGAIEYNGGGNTNTVINCTFIQNSAAYGGALRAINSFSNLKVYNSTFVSNSAKSDGGAISMMGANSEVHNSIFISNSVSKRGGAIDTTSTNTIIKNCTFLNNVASQYGGGIRFSGATSKILNCTFENNVAKLQSGGAFTIGGSANNAYVENVVVRNCSSKYEGSAVKSFNTGTTIVNSIFENNYNTANSNGGAVAFSNNNAKLTNCTFKNNTNYYGGAVLVYSSCTNAVIENCYFYNNAARAAGGAVEGLNTNNKVTIKNSTFINNSATMSGGSVSLNGYSSSVSNCTFINSSGLSGGAMFLNNNGVLTNSRFYNNTASNYGGAVLVGNNVQISLSTFDNNSASNLGGAIYCTYSNLVISSSNFYNCYSNMGGSIYLTSGSNNQIIGCDFKNNVAKTIGGAIYVNAKDSVINASLFYQNKANNYGGAVYSNVKSTIYESNFTNNVVDLQGGAIYISGASFTILKGLYVNNTAKYGGAISIVSQGVLVNGSEFNNNSATSGGAIYWESSYGNLAEANFNNNTGNYGGAAYVNCGNMNITSTTFKKNKAKIQGGAVYSFKELLVNSSNFIENEAFSGGALYLYGNNTKISYSNLTSNIADYGAGFYLVNDIELTKSNFTSNDARIMGGAGYSFVFISRFDGDNTFTYWDETEQIDNLYASFVKLLNDTILTGQNVTLEYSSLEYTGNITLLINNMTFSAIKLDDGVHFIGDVDNLTYGVYDHIFAVYHSDDEYNNSYALISLTVKRLPIDVSLVDNNTDIGGSLRVKVNETDAEGNITIIFEDGSEYLGVIDDDGIAVINLDNSILSGDYNITLYYGGDFKYEIATNLSTINLNKVDFTPRLLYNWTYYEGEITIILPDDASSGTVNFTINGKKFTNDVSNGLVSFNINSDVTAKYYDSVLIEYSGDQKYNAASNTTSFEVSKFPVIMDIDVNTTMVKDNLGFILYSEEADYAIKGTVSFVINGETYSATLSSSTSWSTASIWLGNLPGGVYENVTVTYTCSDKYYLNLEKNFTFELVKYDSEVQYGGDSVVEINSTMEFTLNPTDVSGNVSFIIDGKNYNATISSGVANIDINGLAKGVYDNVLVAYSGDDFYKASNTTISFKVKENPIVDLNISNIVYGQNATLKVNITPNDVSGQVIVYVNKTKKYEGTISSSIFDITLENIEQGNYIVNLTYLGDDKHFSASKSINLTVFRANSKITIGNITNGTYNTTNSTITFNITNKTVVSIVVVNESNIVVYQNHNVTLNYFSINNLTAGNYNITITNALSRNYNASNITALFKVIKAASQVNITNIINGTYYTEDVVVNFDIFNRTIVSIIIKNQTNDIVYQNNAVTANIFKISNLTAGNYNITITNALSGNYNASNMTKSFKVVKATSKVDINNITNGIYNTTPAIIDFTVTNRTMVNISVYENGTSVLVFNNTDFKGDTFTIGNLTPGVYRIIISNNESDNYNASQINVTFEVLKAPSFINLTEIINGVYNTTNATVKFNIINQTTVKITVFNNKTGLIVFNSDDFEQSQFTIGNLTVGSYNIIISNIANDNYTEFTISSLFTINKAQSFVNITEIIAGVYNTTNASVKFNITNKTTVQITIFNNKTNECVYNNTNFNDNIISLGNLTAGTYKIIINNIENDLYESSYNSTLFNVIKANSHVEITNIVNSTFNTTNVEITMNIINKTTVNIIISQGNNVIYKFNNFQENIFVIGNLTSGNYNITITNNENENYNSSNNGSTFSVFKANSNIDIINVVNSTYKINSTIVTINVVNKTSISYIVRNHDGIEIVSGNTSNNEIIISDLNVGEYNITVFNNENNNYLSSNTSALFIVVKSYSKVNITSVENGTYNTQNVTVKFNIIAPTIVNVTVIDSNGEIVYVSTNFEGNIFTISSLPTGIYNITVLNMETDDAYASNDSVLFKVVVPTSIIATDLNRGYNSYYDYLAVFTDEFGNKLNNTNISIIVDGIQYNLTTDENAIAYLNTTTLSVGLHNIQLINPVTGEITNHTTKIVERLQENKDIVMDFCDGTYYRVRAYGDDANPIAGVIVKISINGISYDVKTDKNGYASLKIRLNPNKFRITAEWKGYKINKIVVRQTLKAKSATAKKSAKYFKYSAILKWSNGKAIVGKKITFKFRGKTYTAKTNKKGVATIKIKKSVLKKLRVGKKYKISITYKNIDKGYASINNISKTIKIRK